LAAGTGQGRELDGFEAHRQLAAVLCTEAPAARAATTRRVSLSGGGERVGSGSTGRGNVERCVSCHDGIIAGDTGLNDLGHGAGGYRGGMMGGHSLDVRYDPHRSRSRLRSLDAIVDATGLTVRDLLTEDRRVSCESCHSVCASSDPDFLRLPRATLCLTCHDM
jgi:predicted CXXCH cytochrome family protein